MNEAHLDQSDRKSLPSENQHYNGYRNHVLSSEEWLMERILFYAKQQKYTKYTSTLKEAWRLSISGLSTALTSSLQSEAKQLELTPDENYSEDKAALFGVIEAKRHRERGIDIGMFLGLMKYYRQAYIELADKFAVPEIDKDILRLKTERIFDRIELGFCTEWSNLLPQIEVKELQKKNRELTNEKNRYLTIFETIHAPVILIDENNNIENYNYAWTEIFKGSSVPGSRYYSKNSAHEDSFSILVNEILSEVNTDVNECSIEKELITNKGPGYFQIKTKKMLDISDKYRGMVIILNDVTELKKAERKMADREKLEGALEMAGAVCHEVNQPLQVILGQADLLKLNIKEDASPEKSLDIIMGQIKKISMITQKLTTISKYETKPYLSKNIIDIEKAARKEPPG